MLGDVEDKTFSDRFCSLISYRSVLESLDGQILFVTRTLNGLQ